MLVLGAEDGLLADFLAPLLVEVVRDAGEAAKLGYEVGWSFPRSSSLPPLELVLDDKEGLGFLLDLEVVAEAVVLLEVGDFLADGDLEHAPELNIEDPVEGRFAIVCHDYGIDEDLLELVALLLLVFAGVDLVDTVDDVQDRVIPHNLSGSVHSKEHALLALLEGRTVALEHLEVVNGQGLLRGEVFP